MTRRFRFYGLAAAFVMAASLTSPVIADWRDWLKVLSDNEQTSQVVTSALSQSDIADGLREALGNGVKNAVQQLGKKDGFLANAKLKIPVPEHLQMVESGLRKIGQDEVADQFVTNLNRAAERAVPEAADIFAGAISNMSIDDAQGILNGGDTAATDFLKRTSNDKLKGRFTPLVDQAVRSTGATKSYQDLLDKAGPISAFVDTEKLDLTNYVTDKALDGLYQVIGSEEAKIRANPAARTTDLLKKVFAN